MTDAVVRQHASRLDELEAHLSRLTQDVEDLAGLSAEPDDEQPAHTDGGATSGFPESPVFSAAEDWVHGYLTPTFQRSFGGELRWCTTWHKHPEAVLRLEAMWRAWETLHSDTGLGLSVWLLNHFDPNFAALTSRSGPFARCTTDRHSE